MPNNFKIIYKILSILEKAMEYEQFDVNRISYKQLDIPKALWVRIIVMLEENGYIKRIIIGRTLDSPLPYIDVDNIEITLKGLEYLAENSMMKKAKELAKGMIEIVK